MIRIARRPQPADSASDAAEPAGAEVLEGDDGRLLLICDHASNDVPDGMDPKAPAAALSSHIALDLGAAELTRALARRLSCPAILASQSRLVIDLNRVPERAIVATSDGVPLPGNQALDDAQREGRLALHARYHRTIARHIRARKPALLVSVHSFTPKLASAPDEQRPWALGILWNIDQRAARAARTLLDNEPDLPGPVGANQPYSGKQLNYTMNRHGEANGIPYLGLEVRQDLLAGAESIRFWADLLGRTIAGTNDRLCKKH